MAKLFNRAKMTTSTTGTGTITLGSAATGFQSFADAGVANSDVVQYVIEEGSNFEIGTGTYTSSGTTLSRTPTESSNSDNAISLAGNATVSITAVAADLNRLQYNGSDKVTVSSTGASVTGNLAVSGTVDGVDIATRDGTLTSTTTTANAALPKAGGTMTGDIAMGDNVKAKFGASNDLLIYHNGTNSIVGDVGTGTLSLQSNGTSVTLWDSSNAQHLAAFKVGGSNDLYHNGSKKLDTTSTGISVTGNVTVSGTVDGRDVATDGSKLDGIAASANNYSLPLSSSSTRGGVKIGYAENGKNYPVELSSEKMFVNVPWTDTNTTYSTATSSTLGLVKIGYTENGKNYPVELSSGQMYVNVPWTDTDTNTTYSAGTGMSLSGTTFSIGQAVGTGNSPTFSNLYLSGTLYHNGDTNTYLSFGTDTITLATGGSSEITVNTTGVRLGDTGNGYFQPVSGSYGSIQIDGGAHNGWEGLSIGGRAVLMHDNGNNFGLYNDVNNEWMFLGAFNGETSMYYNGSKKGYTYSSGYRVTGNLLASSNVYAYYSDERLKAKDGVIEDALSMIGSLDTFYYYENDKAKELGHDNDRRQIGVSAQQVEAIMPEAVAPAPFDLESDNEGNKWSKSGEDYLTVDYPRLVPLLIKGIQELEARVKELENGASN